MRLIKDTLPHKIVAEEGKHIRDINDIYISQHIDEKNGELIPEHFPDYSTIIYVPNSITEELINKLYIEEDIKTKK